MHVEHADLLPPFERDKADGRAVQGADQRQLLAEAFGEGLLIVRSSRPGLLLRLAVILGGQFLDAGAEDFCEQRARRPADRAADRLSDVPWPSSGNLPGGAVLGILQHNTHGGQLVADAIGFGEILGLARGQTR